MKLTSLLQLTNLVEDIAQLDRAAEFLYSYHEKKGKIETPKELVEVKKLADEYGAFTVLNELITHGLRRVDSKIPAFKAVIKEIKETIKEVK